MPHYAVDERHALAATLRDTDPTAATLCGEWNAAQLAAHLVLRERSVAEIGGRVPVARLQRRAARGIDELVADRPYAELVAAVDSGPSWTDVEGPVPIAWFWSLPLVREQVNLLEYLVHHEDVRRAGTGWEPRRLPLAVQHRVWGQLGLVGRLTLRSLPVGVVLSWPSHGEIRTRRAARGAPTVTVTGDPIELALVAFGRQGAARVEYTSADGDIEQVRTADIGL